MEPFRFGGLPPLAPPVPKPSPSFFRPDNDRTAHGGEDCYTPRFGQTPASPEKPPSPDFTPETLRANNKLRAVLQALVFQVRTSREVPPESYPLRVASALGVAEEVLSPRLFSTLLPQAFPDILKHRGKPARLASQEGRLVLIPIEAAGGYRLTADADAIAEPGLDLLVGRGRLLNPPAGGDDEDSPGARASRLLSTPDDGTPLSDTATVDLDPDPRPDTGEEDDDDTEVPAKQAPSPRSKTVTTSAPAAFHRAGAGRAHYTHPADATVIKEAQHWKRRLESHDLPFTLAMLQALLKQYREKKLADTTVRQFNDTHQVGARIGQGHFKLSPIFEGDWLKALRLMLDLKDRPEPLTAANTRAWLSERLGHEVPQKAVTSLAKQWGLTLEPDPATEPPPKTSPARTRAKVFRTRSQVPGAPKKGFPDETTVLQVAQTAQAFEQALAPHALPFTQDMLRDVMARHWIGAGPAKSSVYRFAQAHGISFRKNRGFPQTNAFQHWRQALDVMLPLKASASITPMTAEDLQARLAETLGRPVELEAARTLLKHWRLGPAKPQRTPAKARVKQLRLKSASPEALKKGFPDEATMLQVAQTAQTYQQAMAAHALPFTQDMLRDVMAAHWIGPKPAVITVRRFAKTHGIPLQKHRGFNHTEAFEHWRQALDIMLPIHNTLPAGGMTVEELKETLSTQLNRPVSEADAATLAKRWGLLRAKARVKQSDNGIFVSPEADQRALAIAQTLRKRLASHDLPFTVSMLKDILQTVNNGEKPSTKTTHRFNTRHRLEAVNSLAFRLPWGTGAIFANWLDVLRVMLPLKDREARLTPAMYLSELNQASKKPVPDSLARQLALRFDFPEAFWTAPAANKPPGDKTPSRRPSVGPGVPSETTVDYNGVAVRVTVYPAGARSRKKPSAARPEDTGATRPNSFRPNPFTRVQPTPLNTPPTKPSGRKRGQQQKQRPPNPPPPQPDSTRPPGPLFDNQPEQAAACEQALRARLAAERMTFADLKAFLAEFCGHPVTPDQATGFGKRIGLQLLDGIGLAFPPEPTTRRGKGPGRQAPQEPASPVSSKLDGAPVPPAESPSAPEPVADTQPAPVSAPISAPAPDGAQDIPTRTAMPFPFPPGSPDLASAIALLHETTAQGALDNAGLLAFLREFTGREDIKRPDARKFAQDAGYENPFGVWRRKKPLPLRVAFN